MCEKRSGHVPLEVTAVVEEHSTDVNEAKAVEESAKSSKPCLRKAPSWGTDESGGVMGFVSLQSQN